MVDTEVKYLPDLEVNKDNPNIGIKILLEQLRPDWQWENVQTKILQGGYVNPMIHVFLPSLPPAEGLVVRTLGNLEKVNFFTDKEKEVIGLQCAALAGCGPPIHCVFRNGMVLGFLEGRNITFEDFINPQVNCLIAKALAQLHVMDPGKIKTVSGKPSPFDINTDLEKTEQMFLNVIRSIPESMPDPDDNRKLKEANVLSRDELLKEMQFLLDLIHSLDWPRTFNHNDAHGRNMLFNEKENRLYLVDFDMMNYTYENQDVGYMFGKAPYWDLIMGPIEQAMLEKSQTEYFLEAYVRSYVEAKAELLGKAVCEDDVTDMKLQVVMRVILTDFEMMTFGPSMKLSNPEFDGITVGIRGKERYFSQREKLIELAKEYKEFRNNRNN